MHISSNISFGHIRVQNNQAKESKSYPYTFSKKECNDNSKAGVLMVKISEGYYSLKRYEISDSYYFDAQRADFFLRVSHQQLALAVNKKA
jgi:hypothetical protein